MTNTLELGDQSNADVPVVGTSPFPNPFRPGRNREPRKNNSSSTEDLLLREIQPRLKSGIALSVPQIGTDDPEELLQDGMVIALRLLKSAERAGKKVSAGNVSYYALKALRVGRRSTGFRKTDPLHPAAQLSGRCRIHSLDERLTAPQPGEETLTFAELLASRQDDSSTKAARQIDWDELVQELDAMAKEILHALASGYELTLLVPRLGRSRSALQHYKNELAKLIRERLGEDILHLIQERPGWQNNITAVRERLACSRERRYA